MGRCRDVGSYLSFHSPSRNTKPTWIVKREARWPIPPPPQKGRYLLIATKDLPGRPAGRAARTRKTIGRLHEKSDSDIDDFIFIRGARRTGRGAPPERMSCHGPPQLQHDSEAGLHQDEDQPVGATEASSTTLIPQDRVQDIRRSTGAHVMGKPQHSSLSHHLLCARPARPSQALQIHRRFGGPGWPLLIPFAPCLVLSVWVNPRWRDPS